MTSVPIAQVLTKWHFVRACSTFICSKCLANELTIFTITSLQRTPRLKTSENKGKFQTEKENQAAVIVLAEHFSFTTAFSRIQIPRFPYNCTSLSLRQCQLKIYETLKNFHEP
jgi:hypothetical protein